MRISYFPKQAALNSGPVLQAFLTSCKKIGWMPVENDMDADAVVIWSVLWSGRMSANKEIYYHYKKQNKPVFIIEVGSLVRGITWKISLNNVNGLGIFGESDILDHDRPKKLNLSLNSVTKDTTKPILIACQHEKSLQWEGQPSTEQWASNIIDQIRLHTSRPIIIRPHPRYPLNLQNFKNLSTEIPKKVLGTYDSFDLDFNHYHAIINHNSGPSVQGAIAGLPVICDHSSMAFPVSIPLDQIESFEIPDRSQWFITLTHSEYLIEEIEQGTPLKKLQKFLHL